jgi:lysyl-tRNA synthetase class 2
MLRAKILSEVRHFFCRRGYLEIETPHRLPEPIPELYTDPVPSGNWVLHTSPEIFMKRMLSKGYSKIFQICRCFRSHERGQKHLPEFTLLEWYCAGATYLDLMGDCEALFQHVASALELGNNLNFQGKTVSLATPWERLTMAEAFKRFSTASIQTAISEGRFDEVIALEIEPVLGNTTPVFLYDYPIEHGALARRNPEDPELAERFELYVAGVELCNGFSELTDPEEQRKRFEAVLKTRAGLGKPVYPLCERFLKDLEDMPESAGNALGLDRMIMLFADEPTIDAVVAFTPEEL